MPEVVLETFCNKSDKVYVHSNKAEAQAWVKKNLPDATNDGCSILVFYKGKFGSVNALKLQTKFPKLNKKLRIIGAANKVERSFFEGLFTKYNVPRLDHLEGDEIVPNKPHGILIVYEKGRHNVGEFFYDIFDKLNAKLAEQVEKLATNEASLHINEKELMDQLSLLAIRKHNKKNVKCDLKSGRVYFIKGDEVYRYTFKLDPKNKIEEAFLHAEKLDERLAKKIEIHTDIRIHHNRWSAFRGYSKAAIFGIVLGLIVGAIAFVFLSFTGVPLLAPLGATVFGVATVIWSITKGVNKVDKDNRDTIEYGETTFRDISSSFFSGIKNDLQSVFGHVKKLKEAPVSSFVGAVRPSQLLAATHSEGLFNLMTATAALSPSKSQAENKKDSFSCFPFFSRHSQSVEKAGECKKADLIDFDPALCRLSSRQA